MIQTINFLYIIYFLGVFSYVAMGKDKGVNSVFKGYKNFYIWRALKTLQYLLFCAHFLIFHFQGLYPFT